MAALRAKKTSPEPPIESDAPEITPPPCPEIFRQEDGQEAATKVKRVVIVEPSIESPSSTGTDGISSSARPETRDDDATSRIMHFDRVSTPTASHGSIDQREEFPVDSVFENNAGYADDFEEEDVVSLTIGDAHRGASRGGSSGRLALDSSAPDTPMQRMKLLSRGADRRSGSALKSPSGKYRASSSHGSTANGQEVRRMQLL